jgi:hypothetical protein
MSGSPSSSPRGSLREPRDFHIKPLAALGLALVGCAGTSHHARRSPHVPLVVPVGPNVRLPQGGARFLSPTRLAIVTWGSSSCPSVPDKVVVEGPHAIRIHLVTGSWRTVGTRRELVAQPPANGACTEDWGTTPMAVAVDPGRIDVHSRLTIHLYYRDSTKPTTLTAPPL